MKNQKITYVAIIGLVLMGGYFVFNNNTIYPKPEVQESAVVELKNGDTYDLTAGYVTKVVGGKQHTMLAYNGSIPGPTIRVAQGAEVTINFKNNTDLPALLHSHGVRMDNAFDGSQTVQKEMKPGETFVYKLKFPDAGVYWYHPHVKEVYGQALGLFGAFIVTPKGQAYFPPVNREMPIFLSDLPIENGKIAITKDDNTHSLMGHYGNILLLNGQEKFSLEAKSGEVLRLYVVNAANTRPFNFAIKGLKLKLIGADSGAYEKASFVDGVILGPSERAIVDVLLPASGTYEIQNKTPETTYALGTIAVANEKADISYRGEFDTLQSNTATIQSIDPFRTYFDWPHQRRIALSIDMMPARQSLGAGGGGMGGMGSHQMPGGTMMDDSTSLTTGGMGMMGGVPKGGIEWEDDMQIMNEMSNKEMVKWKIVDQDTGKENMDIDWSFKRGSPVKIRIENLSNSMHPMQHPIHFHGQRFLVVARDGIRQTNLVWKDTVLLKAGETVDIVLDISNPGVWMAHCHISEHLEAGMMMKFTVE